MRHPSDIVICVEETSFVAAVPDVAWDRLYCPHYADEVFGPPWTPREACCVTRSLCRP